MITWQDCGLRDYGSTRDLQKELVSKRLTQEIPDTLLLVEHPHIFTLGRGGHVQNILHPGEVPVVEIERGGDVTYHGPGQLVAYPILFLPEGQRDLHRYLRNLEAVAIRVLEAYGIEGVRNSGLTGVWVSTGDGSLKKIASAGVAVKKWVTYHGIALNVSTDLSYFNRINPCGLTEPAVMTTMAELLPEAPPMAEVKERFLQSFECVMTEFTH